MRILLIEDDCEAASYSLNGLAKLGHFGEHVADGREGLILATTGKYDALVIDRMLPGLEGLAVLKTLRGAGVQTPALLLTAADLEMDLVERRVTRGSKKIDLLPREFKLLRYLMQNAERVVTRTMVLEQVWEFHFDPRSKIIETHISRLRAKIDKGAERQLIHTIRGYGYVIRAHS